MTVSAPTRPAAIRGTTRVKRRAPPVARSATIEPAARRPQQLQLESLSAQWQRALDAADRALLAAQGHIPASELQPRKSELNLERQQTATELRRVAAVAGIQPAPWLSPVAITNRMLGLPAAARACLFDLEGVLTDSGKLHAWAWGEVFDDVLLRLSEKTGRQFIPFDRIADYRDYVDGRSRLEGVHAFLDSRGIRLPEGRPGGLAEVDTACGLAQRKAQIMERALVRRGVTALPGALRYLQAATRAGLRTTVVSASASTPRLLDLAGLAALIDQRVDAAAIGDDGLRSRPAPDLLLSACIRLDVRPAETVTLTHSAAGVAAGHAGGLAVVCIADGAQAELLHSFGAERVVASLTELLDGRLRETG
jgi:beta-phosphoglucomutase-like phosphatase (HAD superfamily)